MTISGISSPVTSTASSAVSPSSGSSCSSRPTQRSLSRPRPAEGQPADLTELVVSGLEALGSVTIPVNGSSMLPTLRPGERVVLHAVEPAAIRPQDVIAFRSDGQLVLHRVHAVFPDRVITAGDHCNLFDPPVPTAAVIGAARSIAARPAPPRWPARLDSANVDVWLIGGHTDRASPQSPMEDPVIPPKWRLHWRPAEGVGVSAAVLDEIQGAARGRPCIGVSEHAVYAASDVLARGLPPQTQVLVGCSFGRLDYPMPGHLVPTEVVDLFVRVGPPEVPVSAAEALRRLAALVVPREVQAGGT
jgi:hypothetical protein